MKALGQFETGILFYGDNLPILREHIPDESVDLVYLDPPFNSNRNYNVLFRDESGHSEAQIEAFEDTWHWGETAEQTYYELWTTGPDEVSKAVVALRQLIGANQVMAYLVMIAIRLVELRRVLKRTGSIYLHCDPTASHYLKVVMDAVFGPECFRNEIVWRRTTPKGLMSRRLARNHDIILSYQMSDDATWNNDAAFTAYDPEALDEKTAGSQFLVPIIVQPLVPGWFVGGSCVPVPVSSTVGRVASLPTTSKPSSATRGSSSWACSPNCPGLGLGPQLYTSRTHVSGPTSRSPRSLSPSSG